MGALVQYRDLPGGPTELRLCDELSRHCMCTNCGMLSMSMLQDPNQHMFCETCLMDRSIKYKSDHIYCSYENREVDISEMFEASDLITVIRDQYVKCPNPKCKEYVTLQELKEHYTQCLPAVMCSTCHQQVPSADWSNHNNKCNKQEASGTKSMGAIRKHFQPKEAVPYPNSSPSVKRDSNQNSRETSSLYPSLQEAQRPPQKPTTEDTMLCPYCKRKIKIINLDGHLEKCSKVPHPCIYCKAQFSKEEIKSHVAICESNPDSVHKQKPEKLEVRNTSVAHPPQDHGGRRANVGPANRNASNGARPPSEVLNTSKTNPPQDSGGRRGNEKPGNRNTNQGAKPQSEGNHSDGGESPGEERSSLHTGEKAAFQKHPAKLEAELADKRKCHDTENSSKKDFEKGIIKTGPPFGSYTEYTQKQSASEQMEAATDQACAIAMPSKFNTEPSCKEGTILIGFQDKGNFSRAMVREETSLKAENTSTSVDDSDLKECSELSSGLQPSKNNRVNTTCKDSNISKRLDNLSSAAKGPVQADSFSKSALSPPGAEVSHEKLICSTERTTPSTQNEPAFMGKPEKLDGHPKGIVPENVTKGAKCRTYENETTSASGSNDSGILEDMAKIAIEPPEDRNTSSSLSDRFRRNLRERRLFSQQIRSYKILRKIHSYKILRKTRSYKILRKRALFLRQIMSPHQPRRMYGQFIELTA
ncbi:uncharacterized protein LOC144142516 isoform X4 [Haemaphysalis longicornis]